jgi:hypothetical protein
MSERIKTQQAKIKKELAAFSELQNDTGNKTLAPEQQKMLQQDLQKLEQLQTMLRTNQGNPSLQTQLLGQQVLLSEHLTEAMESIKPKEEPKKTPPPPTRPSPPATGLPNPTDYRMHILQQRALAAEHQIHAIAAEQQMQVMAVEQQRQMAMAAEQQRQMAMAAEQQRQMQVAAMQSPFASPQGSFGGMNAMSNAMSPMYNPYSSPIGYY